MAAVAGNSKIPISEITSDITSEIIAEVISEVMTEVISKIAPPSFRRKHFYMLISREVTLTMGGGD